MNFCCSNLQHSVHKMSWPKVHENVNCSYEKKRKTEKGSVLPRHVLFLCIFEENEMLVQFSKTLGRLCNEFGYTKTVTICHMPSFYPVSNVK